MKCQICKIVSTKPQNSRYIIINDKEKQHILTIEKLEPNKNSA